MIQTRLKLATKKLTNSEKKVAEYIINNPQPFRTMTSYELASVLDVGQSTIIRFSQKLGYDSFKMLQLDVQSDHNNYLREDILIDEPTSAINKKIIAQYIDILKMSLENTEDF
ncbi:MAG: MurR/RpiR family transcriptional regulator, partial [Bacilli bacterium]